ncbi:hypothetical protein V2J09_022475 [Rumex salicifolius]
MSIVKGSLLAATVLLMMSLFVQSIVTPQPTTGGRQVPCYFVFGDSLSDNGNNNNLNTLAKANYQPYGVDFPGAIPTGRFTNNRTFVDVLTELLGFNRYIPHYDQSIGLAEASQGVNYASGGAGILYETGRQNLGEVISFDQQIQNHQNIVAMIGNQVDFTKCLYTINIGNNDYINNYFDNQNYQTSTMFTPTQFATYLIEYYRSYTRIAFYILTQIGCSLGEIAAFGATSCVESVNDAVNMFNSQLVPMINQLNQELPGAKFTYINSSAVELSAYTGVTVFTASCCTPRSDGQCQPQSTPCSNRNQYYFWDLFHPTDAVNRVVAARAYKAQSTAEAYPYDISTLAQL